VYGREGRRACLPLSRRRIREGARLPKVAAAGERAGLEARTQHIGLSQKAARGGDRGSVNKEISTEKIRLDGPVRTSHFTTFGARIPDYFAASF
jgi:hypothetical protein